MQDLGTLPGGSNSLAIDINDLGQVVGYASTPCTPGCGTHAFLWTKEGGREDLGVVPDLVATYGFGINDFRQVTGYATTAGGVGFPFLWTANAGMQNLGNLPGGSGTTAWDTNGINDLGQVVGVSNNNSGVPHAFLWTKKEGIQDLNTLTEVDSPWLLEDATHISDLGQITGKGVELSSGVTQAFVLTPEH